LLRGGVSLGSQLAISTISDGGPGILQQPGERDTVLGRQVQKRSRDSVGQARAAEKIQREEKDGKVALSPLLHVPPDFPLLFSPAARNSESRFQVG
jgi:hypothetical protein